MPNRYEREIEEILRNLEHTEPKQGLGRRLRKNTGPRVPSRPRFSFSFAFSVTEWLLVIAVIAALAGGGYAYAMGRPDLLSAILATIGAVCIILVALSQFLFRSRRPVSRHYGNITVTPIHRNPLTNLKTRWNLFVLRMRYRNKREE